jgi:hypothetical protein
MGVMAEYVFGIIEPRDSGIFCNFRSLLGLFWLNFGVALSSFPEFSSSTSGCTRFWIEKNKKQNNRQFNNFFAPPYVKPKIPLG